MESWLGYPTPPDEDEMEELILDDEIENHWRMVFKDNY